MRRCLVLLLIGGCYQPSVATGVPCGAGEACPVGLECRSGTCELPGGPTDGAIDGPAIDACATPASCAGDDLVTCAATVTCDLGCSEQGEAHCLALAPSNGVSPDLLDGATADVSGEWNFDTDDGEIRKGNTTLRAAGPGVIAGIGFVELGGMGIWTARSFTVGPADDWTGSGGNTMVLYAATTIDVRGVIDVGASGETGGPDGSDGTASQAGTSCRGRAGRLLAAGFGEGGGGGGARDKGGDGGPSNMAGATGLGGASCSSGSTTIPLRGGAGGGHGAGSSSNHGGGGGGAIALVAMESISISGTVGAPGAGGDAGAGTSPSGEAGGGGGSGGAVLVEAPVVTISGEVTANGGGGASPTGVDGVRGSLTSASPASGGSFTGPGGTTTGGRGGAGSQSPDGGGTYSYDDGLGTPTSIVVRGAGGGGSAGRIEIKSINRTTTGSVLSPSATLSTADLE